MDDFESLVYSIWYVAEVPMGRVYGHDIPEGCILCGLDEQEARSRMLVSSGVLITYYNSLYTN